MTRAHEITEKLRRVRGLLAEANLDALVLRTPGNVAWVSAGGRSHIAASLDVGVASVVVTADAVRVVTTVSESPRVQLEEFAELGAEFTVLGWDADAEAVLPAGPRVGSDVLLRDARVLTERIECLRRSLTVDEAARFAAVGAAAAEILTDAALAATPDHTEHEVAALIVAGCAGRGLDAVVLQVAGSGRLDTCRHALPTHATVGARCFLSACVRGGGLIASLTRYVAWGSLEPGWLDAQERVMAVDAAYLLATRVGSRVGEVFQAGTAAYAAHGFEPEEWRRHHQGGPTGYTGRDYLADADSTPVIEARQAFAWNPSAAGVKSEDTVLAGADAVTVLTRDPRWPDREVGGMLRPWILER